MSGDIDAPVKEYTPHPNRVATINVEIIIFLIKIIIFNFPI